MTYTVYAVTEADGPIAIGSFDTSAQAQACCRRERQVLRDDGYAEDVTAIELDSGEAGDAQTPVMGTTRTQTAESR